MRQAAAVAAASASRFVIRLRGTVEALSRPLRRDRALILSVCRVAIPTQRLRARGDASCKAPGTNLTRPALRSHVEGKSSQKCSQHRRGDCARDSPRDLCRGRLLLRGGAVVAAAAEGDRERGARRIQAATRHDADLGRIARPGDSAAAAGRIVCGNSAGAASRRGLGRRGAKAGSKAGDKTQRSGDKSAPAPIRSRSAGRLCLSAVVRVSALVLVQTCFSWDCLLPRPISRAVVQTRNLRFYR
jgi:hypothetical protein